MAISICGCESDLAGSTDDLEVVVVEKRVDLDPLPHAAPRLRTSTA
ncbi:MAG TPA: hypothetical protein VHU88_18275 [Sporichthyaceae bacterium]|jgi:hypothetical protein|nr:hypothetical protein [Sporichthyaceae bacterium]